LSLETAIVAHLEAHSGLFALVGSRIYPGHNTTKNVVYPYIVYRLISNPRQYVCGGTVVWSQPRYQFDCCDDNYDGAKEVGEQLLAALDNRGHCDLGSSTETYTIESCLAKDDVGPIFVPSEEDPRKGIWVRVIDFIIQHNE
jgi:hypothetical protein